MANALFPLLALMDQFPVSGNTLLQPPFSKDIAQLPVARILGIEVLTRKRRHKNSIVRHILVVINMARKTAR
ncbi:hypothetical protein [Pseudomonas kielensis]|uniref:Uncharacterized protein n=1 Tax=Pseudomonas kielensis TaxID=2762577 RepID=A0A7X1GAM0_9PSED|nr:hypothetical protein [Pseudomonas kielensis]MBC2688520.1 hypothetical protein [Pseudomonas kielensis]